MDSSGVTQSTALPLAGLVRPLERRPQALRGVRVHLAPRTYTFEMTLSMLQAFACQLQ